MAGAPLIQVTDLRYTYHAGTAAARPALDGVTFSLDAGEMVAVVGANGSGKSTLAKCLNGLLQPTEGRVLVDGLDTRDAQTLWGIRQRVGMVFQNPDNQLVATVVEEDVAFGPENLGLPSAEIRLRVDQALAAVEMDGYRRHAPHLLSGGQKQRVAIAGILAMRPRCLILDEATTMLDPQGRTEVLETVARLNATEGIAVLLITHAMEDVGQCRRVVVLAQGRIAMDAPPRAIFERAEELKALRLNLPAVVRLGLELRAGGLAMDPLPLSVDELAARVAQQAAPAM